MKGFSSRRIAPALCLVLASVFVVGSCAPPTAQDPKPRQGTVETKTSSTALPTLAWEFDGDIADGIPSTDVYLVVNGTLHPVVDNAFAEYRELSRAEGINWDVPAGRLAACTSSFAGKGDVLYVTSKGRTLEVYRALREEQDDAELFKRIKTIAY